jgi:transglutaminase-like putative cysteine protease
MDTPYQRVLDMNVLAPQPWSMTREFEFGNVMLYGEYTGLFDEPLTFTIDYVVERLPIAATPEPSCARPLRTPQVFARTLGLEQYVDVDDKTRALASDVVGGETNPLRQAGHIYDHVTGSMSYNAAEQSWKGSTAHALACSVGNCNDIHALFVSLCRSGIPARFILGQALEAPMPGQEACDLCGYHCWAEFFVAGLGWLPADASCACKYGTHGLFGDLELNHVAWSVGRDILFTPPQRAGRSLFFAGPYAELGGKPYPVERHVNYSELG